MSSFECVGYNLVISTVVNNRILYLSQKRWLGWNRTRLMMILS